MATDAWTGVRARAVALFRHHRAERAAALETQLDGNAALVSAAGDAQRARSALIGGWQVELEQLLRQVPRSIGELGAFIAETRQALPADQRRWVQHNTARDSAVMNIVQDGIQHNHCMGSPSSRHRDSPPPGDAGGREGDR